MSVLDEAVYASYHLAIARGEVAALKSAVEELYSPPEGSQYALGWLVVERGWAGGKALTHTGSNTMFHTVVWIAPGKNFAIVVSTNAGDREGSEVVDKCDRIVSELISRVATK
jgi:CubicO group peptidase (beta-lactamase class C family)